MALEDVSRRVIPKTKGSPEGLSLFRTDAHLILEHKVIMETPGLPLYGRDELEMD